jgi:hypothetical protein
MRQGFATPVGLWNSRQNSDRMQHQNQDSNFFAILGRLKKIDFKNPIRLSQSAR